MELYITIVIMGVLKFRQSCQTIIVGLHFHP